MVAWQISTRSALTMDELHTLLIARVMASGESVSFFIGSVSRYEGGSWLVCFPVSWLLRLGAWGSAATCWTAAAISLSTVALSSLWLGRHFGSRAALCFGPLVALCAPEVLHYSYRAWGSLAEALIVYPLAALVYAGWQRRGRPLSGAVALGALLATAVVVSYLHMATAILFVFLQWLERRGRPGPRVLAETLLVAVVALALFGLWLWVAVPHLDEALTVRSGVPILQTLPSLLLVRLDLIALSLPEAWMGQHLDRDMLSYSMGTALSLLSVVCAALAWRRGAKARWLVGLWLVLLPALSVGHQLAQPPDVFRYYQPLLLCSLALIVIAGKAHTIAALVLGGLMWLPQGLGMPYQNPSHAYLELGSNALYRFAADPHEKFYLLAERVGPRFQSWFAFGYGLDAGTRYQRDTLSMSAAVSAWRASGRDLNDNPHFVFAEPAAWLPFAPGVEGAAAVSDEWFHRGLGVGLMADAQLDSREAIMLGGAGTLRRQYVMEGLGAAARILSSGDSIAMTDLLAGLAQHTVDADWRAIGRGVGGGISADSGVNGLDLGEGSERTEMFRLGWDEASFTELNSMAEVSVRPTPVPPPATD